MTEEMLHDISSSKLDLVPVNTINDEIPAMSSSLISCLTMEESVSGEIVEERICINIENNNILFSRACMQKSAAPEIGGKKEEEIKEQQERDEHGEATGRTDITKNNNGFNTKDEIRKEHVGVIGGINTVKNIKEYLSRVFLNRYLIVVLYSIYCLLSGPAYVNFQPLRYMLLKSKAYYWVCDATVQDSDDNKFVQNDIEYLFCELQINSIMRLLSIAMTCNFVFSMVGGILVDIIGPKLTSLCGLTFQLCGWVLLGASSETFKGYIAGFVLIGMGVDVAFFPVLSGANLFPKYKSTIIAIFGALRSLTTFVNVALKSVMIDYKIPLNKLFYGFAGCGFGLCIIIALFTIPLSPFEERENENKASSNIKCFAAFNNFARVMSNIKNFLFNNKCMRVVTKCLSTANRYIIKTISSVEYFFTLIFDYLKKAVSNMKCFIVINNFAKKVMSNLKNLLLDNKCMRAITAKLESNKYVQKMIPSVKDFSQHMFSAAYMPIIAVMSISLIRCSYFLVASHILMGKKALDFLTNILLLSFLPCPILGWLSDKIGIISVMQICNFSGLLMVLGGFFRYIECFQYISVVCLGILLSFLLSQLYCYISVTFPKEHTGKLAGIVACIAGLFSLLANDMLEYTSAYKTADLQLGLLMAGSVLIIFLLEYTRRQKNKRLNKLKEQESYSIQNTSKNTIETGNEYYVNEKSFMNGATCDAEANAYI